MARILCVDDEPGSLMLLETLLSGRGHEVFTAHDGVDALVRAHETRVDLVVTDILMPRMDGYRLSMEFRKDPQLCKVPFIFYTASYTEPADEELADRLGAAQFVRKPEEPMKLLGIIEGVLSTKPVGSPIDETSETEVLERYSDRLVQKLEQKVSELEHTLDGVITAMVRVVEIRDPYTAGHQVRVSRLAAVIATRMALDANRVEAVRIAGLLHDLGKLAVPAEILSKPGSLTSVEFEMIKAHPNIGSDILHGIDFPWPIADIVEQHHERIDGSGYPLRIRNGEIMLEARILAVADVVEAMSSHRPYRPAHGIEAALDQIRQDSEEQLLDPDAVVACCDLFEAGFSLEEIPA